MAEGQKPPQTLPGLGSQSPLRRVPHVPSTSKPMEFESMAHFHHTLPSKAQKGLFSIDVAYTCLDASPDYIAIGTDVGVILVYDRHRHLVQRLSCQSKTEIVTSVKMQQSVDYVVAAGTASGLLVIFQLPSILPGRVKQMFTVRDMHRSKIVCQAWSQNAMKLFSGDVDGNVVCTEMDYNTGKSSSYVVCHESHAVVQLDYAFKTLVISTTFRSVLCHMDKDNSLIQIGTKPRKNNGTFGGCFMHTLCRPEEAIVYACRPGMRVWKSDMVGVVQATYMFKNLLDGTTPVLTLLPDTMTDRSPSKSQGKNFGQLKQFGDKLLVTWNEVALYVLDPDLGAFVGQQNELGHVQDVAVSRDEIFILREGHRRRVVRIALQPDLLAPLGTPPALQDSPVLSRRSSSPMSGSSNPTASPSHILHQTANKIVDALKEVGEKIQEGQREPPWGAAGASKHSEDVSRSPSIDSCKEAGSSSATSPAKSLSGEVLTPSRLPSPQEETAGDMSSPLVRLVSDDVLTVEITETLPQGGSGAGEKLAQALGPLQKSKHIIPDQDIVFTAKNKKTKKKKLKGRNGVDKDRDSDSVTSLDVDSLIGSVDGTPESHLQTAKLDTAGNSSEDSLDPKLMERLKPGQESKEVISSDSKHISPVPEMSPSVGKHVLPNSIDSEKGNETNLELALSVDNADRNVRIQSSSANESVVLDNYETSHPPNFVDAKILDPSLPELHVFPKSNPNSIEVGEAEEEGKTPVMVKAQEWPSAVLPDPVKENQPKDKKNNSPEPKEAAKKGGWLKKSSYKKSPNQDQRHKPPQLDTEKFHQLEDVDKWFGSDTFSTPSKQPLTPYEPKAGMEFSEPKSDIADEDSPANVIKTSDSHTSIASHSQTEISPISSSGRSIYRSDSSSTDDFYGRYQGDNVESSEMSIEDVVRMGDTQDLQPAENNEHADLEQEESSKKGTAPSELHITLADSWSEFLAPGNLQSLCLSERHIWCVDKSERLHYSSLSGPGLKWRKVEKPAKQISVSPSGWIVWKLHHGSIYAGTKITGRAPAGLKWVEVARDVADMALDDSMGWYIKSSASKEVVVQKGLSKDRPSFRSIKIPCSARLVQIEACNGVVWALTEKRTLTVRVGCRPGLEEGSDWQSITGQGSELLVCHFAMGDQGTAWAVDVVGRVWFTTQVTTANPMGSGHWWQVSISEYLMQDSTALDSLRQLTQFPQQLPKLLLAGETGGLISVGKNGVWICPGSKHVIHVCRGSLLGHRWEVVTPSGMAQSCRWLHLSTGNISGNEGMIWVQQPNAEIFCLSPNIRKVVEVEGPLAQHPFSSLSASEEAVWGVMPDGRVFVRAGMGPHCPHGFNWVELNMTQLGDSRLIHLSCGTQNVWATDLQGNVYLRIGVGAPSRTNLNPAWVPVEGTPNTVGARFTKVFTGLSDWMVWAVDSRKCVYVRQGITDSMPIGTHWVYVSGTPAESLCISEHLVYAVNASGEVLVRYGITPENIAGDYWKKIPGAFQALDVTCDDELWGINMEGQLCRRSTHYLQRTTALPELASPSQRASLGDDWELI